MTSKQSQVGPAFYGHNGHINGDREDYIRACMRTRREAIATSDMGLYPMWLAEFSYKNWEYVLLDPILPSALVFEIS